MELLAVVGHHNVTGSVYKGICPPAAYAVYLFAGVILNVFLHHLGECRPCPLAVLIQLIGIVKSGVLNGGLVVHEHLCVGEGIAQGCDVVIPLPDHGIGGVLHISPLGILPVYKAVYGLILVL